MHTQSCRGRALKSTQFPMPSHMFHKTVKSFNSRYCNFQIEFLWKNIKWVSPKIQNVHKKLKTSTVDAFTDCQCHSEVHWWVGKIFHLNIWSGLWWARRNPEWDQRLDGKIRTSNWFGVSIIHNHLEARFATFAKNLLLVLEICYFC